MDLTTAQRAAEEIMTELAPACARIEVAGSIRRRKDEVGDVELVVIPRRERPAFGQAPGDTVPLYALTDQLRGEGRMIPRLDKRGRAAWGDKFRRALWTPNDGRLPGAVPLDLFITTPDQWGVIYLLRTGDADFSHTLVTKRPHGALPRELQIDQGRVWRGDVALPTPEEPDVFDAIGVPWITPAARTRARLLAMVERPLAP
jgi:DNA polymerase/3'-5' exonuclease PolX